MGAGFLLWITVNILDIKCYLCKQYSTLNITYSSYTITI